MKLALWAPCRYKYGHSCCFSIINIRRSHDRHIFIIRMLMLLRRHLYIETASCSRFAAFGCGSSVVSFIHFVHDDVTKWKPFPRYWPFCEWNPPVILTKASDAELWCFLWSAPEQTVEQTMETPVIWDAIALIMTSLCWFRFTSFRMAWVSQCRWSDIRVHVYYNFITTFSLEPEFTHGQAESILWQMPSWLLVLLFHHGIWYWMGWPR